MLPSIDFSQLTWQEFEDLVTDLLKAEGFKNVIKIGGSGGDMGRDISADELRSSKTGQETLVRWVVQVKHYAGQPSKRGARIRNVGHGEIAGPLGFLDTHRARGLLLVTDTDLTPSAAQKIIDFHETPSHSYEAAFWNGRTLTDRLRRHPALVEEYFKPQKQSASVVSSVSNPYKFLEPFYAADHQRFFGRGREIKDLVGLVHNVRVCVLFGESGTGKTSLLNAGLLPALATDHFSTAYARCLDSPTSSIRSEVARTLRLRGSDEISGSLAAAESLSEFLKEVGAHLARTTQRLVIVVDQFEELFTRASERERKHLAEAITSIHIDGGLSARLTLLFALREDYLGSLWNWSAENSLLEVWGNTYRLMRLGHDAATESIKAPMVVEGVTPDPKFIQSVITDLEVLGDGKVYPPYIQIVAGVLYENAGSAKSMGTALYDELGKSERIIGDYLDERLFTGLTPAKATIAKGVLDSLTGGEGLRTILSLDEIVASLGHLDLSEVQDVLGILVKRRVVISRAHESGSSYYELVHDFLSRRFFDRLDPKEKQKRAIRDVFLRAFREWKEHRVLISKSTLDEFYAERSNLPITNRHYSMILESAFATGKYAAWRNHLGFDAATQAIEYVLAFSQNESAIAIALRHTEEIRYIDKVELVRKHLQLPNWWLSEKAVQCLGALGELRAVDDILPWLENEWVRHSAVRALAEIGDRRVVPRLIDMLQTSEGYFRASVAAALGSLGDERAIPPLMAVLREDFDPTKISHVRSSVITALGELRAKNAVEPLIEQLGATHGRWPYLIEVIAEALQRIGDPRALKPLVNALPHAGIAKPSVIHAVGALGGLDMQHTILATLETDDGPTIVAAAEVLGKIGDSNSIPVLRAAVQRVPDAQVWVVWRAIEQLERAGNELNRSSRNTRSG